MMRGAGWLSALVAMLGCGEGGSRPATQVLVVVHSDLTVGSQLASLRASVRTADGATEVGASDPLVLAASAAEATPPLQALPLSFGIAQPPGGAGEFRLVVTGFGPPGADGVAARVIEQQALVQFEEGHALRMTMFLGGGCLRNFCETAQGEAQTCQITPNAEVPASCRPVARAALERVVPAHERDGIDWTTFQAVPRPPPDGDLPGNAGAVEMPPAERGGVEGDRSGAAQLAAGALHNCARLRSGRVACWGYDGSGELGDGRTTMSAAPKLVPDLFDVVAVSAAGIPGSIGSHSCALKTDGTALCWGNNTDGRLGRDDGTNARLPAPVQMLDDAASVAAGATFTCALRRNRSVACWGDIATGSVRGAGAVPRVVPGLADAVELAAGAFHACARKSDDTVVCWGSNDAGQLGDGSHARAQQPVAVTELRDVVGLTAGGTFTCARRQDETVVCWGDNQFGSLGNGRTVASPTPVVVAGLSDVVQVEAGTEHACALRRDGTVSCWGRNGAPQASGTGPAVLQPQAVADVRDVVELAAGDAHTCARRGRGDVICWGDNSYGQLGFLRAGKIAGAVRVSGLEGP